MSRPAASRAISGDVGDHERRPISRGNGPRPTAGRRASACRRRPACGALPCHHTCITPGIASTAAISTSVIRPARWSSSTSQPCSRSLERGTRRRSCALPVTLSGPSTRCSGARGQHAGHDRPPGRGVGPRGQVQQHRRPEVAKQRDLEGVVAAVGCCLRRIPRSTAAANAAGVDRTAADSGFGDAGAPGSGRHRTERQPDVRAPPVGDRHAAATDADGEGEGRPVPGLAIRRRDARRRWRRQFDTR